MVELGLAEYFSMTEKNNVFSDRVKAKEIPNQNVTKVKSSWNKQVAILLKKRPSIRGVRRNA